MNKLKTILGGAIQTLLEQILSKQRLGERFFRITRHFDINRICHIRHQKITLNVSNEIELWRAFTSGTKEPETLSWIDENFKPYDVFYDIGANIGIYSLYARARLGSACRVYAFEPESKNFAQLYKNIYLNQFSEELQAFPLAISDTTRLDHLSLRAFLAGSARHRIGRNSHGNQSGKSTFVQSIMCVSLDDLVYKNGLPIPNHVKIDVDGHELPILKGAMRILEDNRVRSLLVEAEYEGYDAIVDLLVPLSFRLTERSESKTNCNCIFVRG